MCLDLVGPVQQQIMVALKEAGRATAEELGQSCFLSAGATRQHLVSLESDGLVEHEIERRGPGRPRHFYVLTTRGHHLFAQGYVELSTMLLDEMGGADAELQDRVRGRLRRCFLPTPPPPGTPTSLEDVVAGFDAKGFLPRTTAAGHTVHVTLGHCPVWEIAQKHRLLCETEKQLLMEVLGVVNVQRLSHTLEEGEYRCLYSVEFDRPQSDSEPNDSAASGETPCPMTNGGTDGA